MLLWDFRIFRVGPVSCVKSLPSCIGTSFISESMSNAATTRKDRLPQQATQAVEVNDIVWFRVLPNRKDLLNIETLDQGCSESLHYCRWVLYISASKSHTISSHLQCPPSSSSTSYIKAIPLSEARTLQWNGKKKRKGDVLAKAAWEAQQEVLDCEWRSWSSGLAVPGGLFCPLCECIAPSL